MKDKKTQFFQAQFKTIPSAEAKDETTKTATLGTVIKGFASTPTKDRYDDVVDPTAFEDTIQKNYRKNPIILFQHKNDRPIGKATHMSISEKGLYIEALIVDNEVEPKIQAGILKTLSIGYVPQTTEYRDKNGLLLDPKIEVDRMRIYQEDGVTRVIKKLELVENSIVSVPANPDAIFDMAKSVKSYFDKEAEELKTLDSNNSLNTTTMKKDKNLLETKEEEENAEAVEAEKVEEAPAEEVDKTETEADTANDKPDDAEEATEAGEDKPTDDEKLEGGEGDEISAEDKPEEEATEADEGATEEVEATDEDKTLAKIATPEGAKVAYDAILALKAKVKELESIISKTPAKKALAYTESSVKETKDVGIDGNITKVEDDEKTDKPEDSKKGFKDALLESAI